MYQRVSHSSAQPSLTTETPTNNINIYHTNKIEYEEESLLWQIHLKLIILK